MRRCEAQSFETIDRMHGFEQLHKRRFLVDLREFVPPIKIHDLSKQRDLLNTPRNEITYFAHDFVNGTASLRTARLRHDAKCALHVASLHNRNERCRFLRSELLLANG